MSMGMFVEVRMGMCVWCGRRCAYIGWDGEYEKA